MIDDGLAVAGWYPDPWRAAPLRWWDGTTWTGHLAWRATFERATARLDLAKERDVGRHVRWGAWLIGLGQLTSLAVFTVMADGLVKVARFASENPSSDDVPPGVGQLVAASTVAALVSPLSLVGVVLLLVWLHRAVTNGIALGYRPPREPTLAVLSWFIPVVSFWWPYESVRECVSPQDGATRALVKRWWIAYLAASVGLLVVPVAVLWLPALIVLAAGAVAIVLFEVRLLRQMVSSVLASHTAATGGEVDRVPAS